MFENLELLRMSHALARHAGTRQAVIAANIAQADTPGYLRRDIKPFAEIYRAGQDLPALAVETEKTVNSPNGNGVSVETEIVHAAEVRNQHDMALSVYQSTLDIIRLSIGRR